MIVDAYSHCGLSKYEPIENVRSTMAAAGVERAVLVQHLGEYDNAYLGGIAAAEPNTFASVCLVDPAAADSPDTLRRLAGTGQFRGVRLTTESLVAAPELFLAAADSGLIIVVYAPQGAAGSVRELRTFLRSRPQAKLVLTHLGNPSLADGPAFASQRPVCDLARFEGVYYQVSGMKMFCPLPHEPLYPLLDMAARAFGPRRLLWGSNYPVVGTVADYQADLRLTLAGKLPIPREAIADVVGGNAARLWFADSS